MYNNWFLKIVTCKYSLMNISNNNYRQSALSEQNIVIKKKDFANKYYIK